MISTSDNATSSFDYGLDMGTESQVENPLVDADNEDVHTAILRDHISVTMLKNRVSHRQVFNFSQYDEDIDIRPHQHYHRKIYPSRYWLCADVEFRIGASIFPFPIIRSVIEPSPLSKLIW